MKHLITGYFFFIVVLCIVIFWYGLGHTFHFSQVINSSQKTVMGMSTQDKNNIQTTVIRVIDGDTFITKEQQKVRYIGINAPEINEPYGMEATQYNKTLIEGKNVHIVLDNMQKDRFGRILGYVYIGDTLINKQIIAKGWAIAENISPNTLHAQEFQQAEKEAHKTCQGIWADTCMPLSQSCIKITNIHFDAKGEDNQNLNDEWVEIKSTCSSSLDLSNWLLKDSSAQNNYHFGTINILPNSTLVLHSGCGNNTTGDIYWQCPQKQTAIWNNTGDEALLFDNHGKLLSDYSY